MKTSNIFQKLKATGAYNTDGMKPQLPGLQSPLKKSPYKFNAGLKKAAAEGKLDNNPKFKNAVESSPAKLAPVVAAVGKKALVGVAKKMIAKKAAEKASPAMMNGKPKKKGPKKVALDKRAIADADAKKAVINTKTPKNYDYPTGLKGEFYPKTESKKIKKYPSGVKGDKYKASPAKKYKSDAQRKAVHASKAEKASPAAMKEDGKKAKLISEKKDPKTGVTTRKYDVGTNMPKISKTKASPAKKGCGSPVKMDIEGRKPKTRRNKAQKGVNKMLGGLANANRGCKPHRKIKSR